MLYVNFSFDCETLFWSARDEQKVSKPCSVSTDKDKLSSALTEPMSYTSELLRYIHSGPCDGDCTANVTSMPRTMCIAAEPAAACCSCHCSISATIVHDSFCMLLNMGDMLRMLHSVSILLL